MHLNRHISTESILRSKEQTLQCQTMFQSGAGQAFFSPQSQCLFSLVNQQVWPQYSRIDIPVPSLHSICYLTRYV